MNSSRGTTHLMLALLVIAGSPGPAAAQMDWRKLAPPNRPPPRYSTAVAYDAARDRVALFGGTWLNAPLNDTWEWDGRSWTLRSPTTSPPGRVGHAMAYDASRARVLLFGGAAGTTVFFNDTWEWDGTDWTKLFPATSPSPRTGHAMAYDAWRRRVLLFGGSPSSETWEWDGRDWTQWFPATSPPPRFAPSMAWDPGSGGVLLFGGVNNVHLRDTWRWDGSNWAQLSPSTSPQARAYAVMTYDEARQRVVLHGGGTSFPRPGQSFRDTWEWDGQNWVRVATASFPTGSGTEHGTYEAARGSTLVFLSGNTWIYAPTDFQASTHVVSASAGGNVFLYLEAPTYAYQFYQVLGCVDPGSVRGLQLGKVTLLLNPDPYFWLLVWHPNTLIEGSLGQLDPFGKATAVVRVPQGLPGSLVGVRFYHAYVVFSTSVDYASTPVPLTLAR